jgi:hypothetical protein
MVSETQPNPTHIKPKTKNALKLIILFSLSNPNQKKNRCTHPNPLAGLPCPCHWIARRPQKPVRRAQKSARARAARVRVRHGWAVGSAFPDSFVACAYTDVSKAFRVNPMDGKWKHRSVDSKTDWARLHSEHNRLTYLKKSEHNRRQHEHLYESDEPVVCC